MNLAQLRSAALLSRRQTAKTYGPDPKLLEQLIAAERSETDRIYQMKFPTKETPCH